MENTKITYQVIDLDADESHGEFDTLDEARGCVRYDRLRAFEIIQRADGDFVARRDHCEPYDGDDDRVKQGLGMPNASEGN